MDLSTPAGMLVLDGPGGLYSHTIEAGSRFSQLFVMVNDLISTAGIAATDIGLIGVGRGPGSFTGVRVGVVAAKALASVLGTPLVAPDSLEVMSMGAEGILKAVLVALDARRGEVYYGLYRLEEGYPVVLQAPQVAAPEVAVESLASWRAKFPTGMGIVGTGVAAFPHAWPHDLVVIPVDSSIPQGLARLCHYMADRGETSDPLELLPLYLRRPDARERF
jgi:tRNA threonylcarbamoyladenosine biosynthesis protein TsaB